MIKNFQKHISYDDRLKIEECISKRLRKFQTAQAVGKQPSTIAKEIKRNRILKSKNQFNNNFNKCIHLNECKVCLKICKKYEEQPCLDRDRFIGACNCCSKLSKCKLDKYFYKAKSAQPNYEYTLIDSRKGVNLTTNELFSIAHIIKPLIEQGQSLYNILENHKEIDLCPKTLYTYIEMGLFNDWGITNLSLKRKVKRKISKKKLKKEMNQLIILEENMKTI